jgi:hypothetical protein
MLQVKLHVLGADDQRALRITEGGEPASYSVTLGEAPRRGPLEVEVYVTGDDAADANSYQQVPKPFGSSPR